jgi:hypothetical protein
MVQHTSSDDSGEVKNAPPNEPKIDVPLGSVVEKVDPDMGPSKCSSYIDDEEA